MRTPLEVSEPRSKGESSRMWKALGCTLTILLGMLLAFGYWYGYMVRRSFDEFFGRFLPR